MRRTGFTLIELLIVIAIISLLIAISLPMLRSSKQHANAVACGSNLKQLSMAMAVYEQQNDTFPFGFDDSITGMVMPPPGDYPGSGTFDMRGWWWFHFLAGVVGENFGKKSIVWCPSRCVSDPYILCGNYGANRSICKTPPDGMSNPSSEFVGEPLGLNQIHSPGKTLLLMDSGYSLISWQGASDLSSPYFENPQRNGAFYVPGLAINKQRSLDGTVSPGFQRDAIYGRHPGKTINTIFADSHLARLRADVLFVEQAGGSYRNRSPLWLPNE